LSELQTSTRGTTRSAHLPTPADIRGELCSLYIYTKDHSTHYYTRLVDSLASPQNICLPSPGISRGASSVKAVSPPGFRSGICPSLSTRASETLGLCPGLRNQPTSDKGKKLSKGPFPITTPPAAGALRATAVSRCRLPGFSVYDTHDTTVALWQHPHVAIRLSH
jgi:hypothetical protein